ncbi:MAG: Crp/Fnr family transcriptional regulator [Myxococcota bacterium]
MPDDGQSTPGHDLSSPKALIRQLLAPHLEASEAELAVMAQSLRPASFARGEAIYRPGEVTCDLCLMETGMIRAYYVHEAREINLRLVVAPSVAVSLPSLITGQPADEWVSAITPVRGFRAELALLERRIPEFTLSIRRVLAEQHYLSLERRLRMLQHKSVSERYAYFCDHMEPEIVANTPGYHVASYLGLSPETLSRARRAGRS